jgi:Cft2 family RNA processing exonuclease
LELNEWHWIELNPENHEGISVCLIDSCHILGAVMFLFEGKNTRTLYTGDFRLGNSIKKNPILFPEKYKNPFNKGISVPINHLILDNTFCDPKHKFPHRVILRLS